MKPTLKFYNRNGLIFEFIIDLNQTFFENYLKLKEIILNDFSGCTYFVEVENFNQNKVFKLKQIIRNFSETHTILCVGKILKNKLYIHFHDFK